MTALKILFPALMVIGALGSLVVNRSKMHLCASHVSQAAKYCIEVANWLEKHCYSKGAAARAWNRRVDNVH